MFIGQVWSYKSKGAYPQLHELLVIFKPSNPVSENSYTNSDVVAVLDKRTLSLQGLVRMGLRVVMLPTVEVNHTQFKSKYNKLEDVNPQLCARLGIG